MAPLSPQSSHIGLLAPLCTSAATVGLALYQYPVFTSFLQPETGLSGKPLSKFWEPMVKSGRALIAGLALTSTVSGAIAARWLTTHITLETTEVSKWYIAGSVLAAGHLAAVPLLAGPVNKIISASGTSEKEVEEANRKEMSTWLTLHTARLVLLDLPALWCFSEGIASGLWLTNV